MAFDSTSYHAIAALDLRYGLQVDGDEFNRICERVRTGEAEWMLKQNHQRDWYKIPYQGTVLLAVYDSYMEQIVTFLPADRMSQPLPPRWRS